MNMSAFDSAETLSDIWVVTHYVVILKGLWYDVLVSYVRSILITVSRSVLVLTMD